LQIDHGRVDELKIVTGSGVETLPQNPPAPDVGFVHAQLPRDQAGELGFGNIDRQTQIGQAERHDKNITRFWKLASDERFQKPVRASGSG